MMKGVSYRNLALLVFGPFLADLMVNTILFWMNMQAVRMGAPPRKLAFILGLLSIGYMLSSHCAGRWVTTSRRAGAVITGAVVLMAILGVATPLAHSFWSLPVLSFCLGVLSAHYFVSFQMKMSNVNPFSNLAWTVAFYNVSWGTGYAIGPFLCGWLREKPVSWFPATLCLIAMVHSALMALVGGNSERMIESVRPRSDLRSTPLMRKTGWIGALGVCILSSGLSATLWPALGGLKGLSDKEIGLGLFVFSIQTPFVSLFIAPLRHLMVKPWLFLAFLCLNAVAFLAVPFVLAWPWSLIPMGACGACFAGAIFHAIYYANADAEMSARSVAVNESLFAAGNIVGPFAIGFLAWNDAASLRPYVAGALLLTIVAAAILRMRRRIAA